jgi:hypothetical protein
MAGSIQYLVIFVFLQEFSVNILLIKTASKPAGVCKFFLYIQGKAKDAILFGKSDANLTQPQQRMFKNTHLSFLLQLAVSKFTMDSNTNQSAYNPSKIYFGSVTKVIANKEFDDLVDKNEWKSDFQKNVIILHELENCILLHFHRVVYSFLSHAFKLCISLFFLSAVHHENK